MIKLIAIFLALAIPAFAAELPPSYTVVEKRPFKPDINTEALETHPIYKNEPKSEAEHPVYKPDDRKHEGRARIEPVRPSDSMMKYERMLSDQPTGSTEINRIDNPTNYAVDQPSDVAYPEYPYAPGYGYDSGYPASNNYDLFRNDFMLEPDTSTSSLLWSQVPDARTLVSYVGRTISWIFGSMFMIFFGSLLTVGVCTYTNLCTFAFHGVGPIHEEMRSLITPERLENISTAADFVKNAIDKYQKIQKVTDLPARQRRHVFY